MINKHDFLLNEDIYFFNNGSFGVLAAFYREKSESVYPAIMVHI